MVGFVWNRLMTRWNYCSDLMNPWIYMNFSLTERLCVMVSKIESNLNVSTQQLSPYPQSHLSHQLWSLQGAPRRWQTQNALSGLPQRGLPTWHWEGDQGAVWRCSFRETIHEGLLARKGTTIIYFQDMSPAKTLHTLSPLIQPDIAMQELSKDPHPHHRHISPLLCTRNGPIVHELNFKPTVQVKI